MDQTFEIAIFVSCNSNKYEGIHDETRSFHKTKQKNNDE